MGRMARAVLNRFRTASTSLTRIPMRNTTNEASI
jgi:hypothetical protein